MNDEKIEPKKKTQTRVRNPKEKSEQLERILNIGKDLLLEEGPWKFSMRRLAKNLDMNQNNLYNYVESKRELWIAIRRKCFEQYRTENIELIKNHKGSNLDLLIAIIEHFFEFAEKDFQAFRIMHVTPSPPSDKKGPYEIAYEPFNYLISTIKLVQKSLDNHEIKGKNAEIIAYFIYTMLLGFSIVEYELKETEKNITNWSEIDEVFQFRSQTFTSSEFRKFYLKVIRSILTSSDILDNK